MEETWEHNTGETWPAVMIFLRGARLSKFRYGFGKMIVPDVDDIKKSNRGKLFFSLTFKLI